MRIIRGLGAALAWLLATVLLLLAVVLSITIVLLPVGLLLGVLALRLYKLGLRWALPRASDVRKGVRKEARRWRRAPPVRAVRDAARLPGRRRGRWRPRRAGRRRR